MLLDTSVIIDIFRSNAHSERFREMFEKIKGEELYISSVQIAEVAAWCLKNGIDPEKRVPRLMKVVNVVPLDSSICIEGAKIRERQRRKGYGKFGLIDGLVLASARSIEQELMTADKDFKGMKDVILVR